MSLFLNYRSQLATADLGIASTDQNDNTTLISSHELIDWLEFGVSAALGAQLQLTPQLRLGLNLRLPSIRVFQILDRSTTNSSTLDGKVTHDVDYHETLNIPPRILYPPRLHAGLSYQLTASRIALEWNYQAPFHNEETGEDFRPLVNVRLGYRHLLRRNVELGGGLFTNRSANRKSGNLGDAQINYYGLTLATQLGTPYEVSKRGDKELQPKGRLTFGSAFALSYAIGVGTVVHGELGYEDETATFFRQTSVNVIAHEWVLSVGSSLFE